MHHDIGLAQIQCQKVLVVILGRIELLQRDNLGDDRFGKSLRIGKLTDEFFRGLLLLLIGVKDRRAVLAAGIRALAVELGGIVRHTEKYLQQLLIGNLRRIEMDAHRFGMPGIAIAD